MNDVDTAVVKHLFVVVVFSVCGKICEFATVYIANRNDVFTLLFQGVVMHFSNDSESDNRAVYGLSPVSQTVYHPIIFRSTLNFVRIYLKKL